MTDAETSSRYSFSFTAGALLTRESMQLAPYYLDEKDWERVRSRAVAENLLQARTHRASVRQVSETVKRLSALTDDEVEVLLDATGSERAHLLWAAACRRYTLIGEFAEDVVRERFLVLAPALSYEDFDSFIRAKALWHEELRDAKPTTMQKLRSNVFKMLAEAGLLADGHIVPAVLSDRLIELLNARTPSDVRFFPTRSAA